MIHKIEGFKPFQRQNPILSKIAQVPEKQKVLLQKICKNYLNRIYLSFIFKKNILVCLILNYL